jgi:hypothetical protein
VSIEQCKRDWRERTERPTLEEYAVERVDGVPAAGHSGIVEVGEVAQQILADERPGNHPPLIKLRILLLHLQRAWCVSMMAEYTGGMKS